MLLFTCLLAGCVGADKNGLAEDYEELTGQAENTALSKMTTMPKHIEKSTKGGAGTLKIDADVSAQGFGSAKVYRQEIRSFHDSDLKELAGRIFDDGEYEILKPYYLYSPEEFEAEKEFVREQAQLYAKRGSSVEGEVLRSVESDREEECWWAAEKGWDGKMTGDEYEEGKVIYHVLANQDATYFINRWDFAEPFSLGQIRGRIGETYHELLYLEYEGSYDIRLRPLASLGIMEYYNEDEYEAYPVFGENLCDRNEAIKQAEELLARIGFADYVLGSTAVRVADIGTGSSSSAKLGADGYHFTFTRQQDDMKGIVCSSVWFSKMQLLEEAEKEPEKAYQSAIDVQVDSTGCLRMELGQIYDETECIEENPKLFSAEKAAEIAGEWAQDVYAGTTQEFTIAIDQIELCYLTANYDGVYSKIPVWVFYLKDTKQEESYFKLPNAYLTVNALDGSVYTAAWDEKYGRFFYGTI